MTNDDDVESSLTFFNEGIIGSGRFTTMEHSMWNFKLDSDRATPTLYSYSTVTYCPMSTVNGVFQITGDDVIAISPSGGVPYENA